MPIRLEWWAQRNGCDETPKVENSFNVDVQHYSWTCNGITGVQQHYKIDDMGKLPAGLIVGSGHCWASTEPNFSQISVGEGPTHIEASQVVMDFFGQFQRPLAEVDD